MPVSSSDKAENGVLFNNVIFVVNFDNAQQCSTMWSGNLTSDIVSTVFMLVVVGRTSYFAAHVLKVLSHFWQTSNFDRKT